VKRTPAECIQTVYDHTLGPCEDCGAELIRLNLSAKHIRGDGHIQISNGDPAGRSLIVEINGTAVQITITDDR
jgi:hypothetical protein